MYEIITTRRFMRSARKFLRKHPDIREYLKKIIDDLKDDPFQPTSNSMPWEENWMVFLPQASATDTD